jgi:hypothetical protein
MPTQFEMEFGARYREILLIVLKEVQERLDRALEVGRESLEVFYRSGLIQKDQFEIEVDDLELQTITAIFYKLLFEDLKKISQYEDHLFLGGTSPEGWYILLYHFGKWQLDVVIGGRLKIRKTYDHYEQAIKGFERLV